MLLIVTVVLSILLYNSLVPGTKKSVQKANIFFLKMQGLLSQPRIIINIA